ncbi:MAG: alpha/beta hydrolase [Chloroflexi bacterium]|nr:alpha/beta hydrolase [Chloroflexota bacterium]
MATDTHRYVKRGFVHSPHGNIDYRESGDGPPLILLHGTPSSSAHYADAFPYLEGDFRCIAMSTMGYGDSDRPPEPYKSIHEFAQCVVWLMDGLGVERASVFASHTGAVIATEVAASWPERVDKLVVEELFNWGTPARFAVHQRLHQNPEKPDGSHLAAGWVRAHEWLGGGGAPRAEAHVRQAFFDAAKAHAGDPTDVYDGMTWGGAAPWSMCHYDTWEAAPRIQAPTLVIHGANSELGRAHARLLETIPRSRGIRPPAPNQYDWRVDPELWSREIKAFLRDPGV